MLALLDHYMVAAEWNATLPFCQTVAVLQPIHHHRCRGRTRHRPHIGLQARPLPSVHTPYVVYRDTRIVALVVQIVEGAVDRFPPHVPPCAASFLV